MSDLFRNKEDMIASAQATRWLTNLPALLRFRRVCSGGAHAPGAVFLNEKIPNIIPTVACSPVHRKILGYRLLDQKDSIINHELGVVADTVTKSAGSAEEHPVTCIALNRGEHNTVTRKTNCRRVCEDDRAGRAVLPLHDIC